MIGAWMLYCLLCTAGFSLAATLAERVLLRGRGSIRMVWMSAVAISVLVPAIAFRFADRTVVRIAPPPTETSAANLQLVSGTVANVQASAAVPTPLRTSSDWRATLARLDDSLRIVWITLSIAVAFNFLGGVLVLRWMRRSWEKRSLLGVPVYLSERTGPAVVGAFSPAIVLPRWVLALDSAQLQLMLRHEQEHQRAGDGRLLTIAQLALIVMPWNPALWWQIVRLRVAVELDCDARVLRQADARAYGDLLLEVARPRRGPALLGVTAFAERAAQLERRIRLLGRHRNHTTRGARAVASIIGAVALTAAWAAPRPPVPARTIREVPAQTDRPAPALPTLATIAPVAHAPVDRPATSLQRAPVTQRSIELDDRPVPCGGASTKEAPRLADLAFDVLFSGIKLTSAQASRACDLLIRLQDEQAREDQAAAATMQANRARRAAVEAQRDSTLRALLTSDADRALFEQHRTAISFSFAGAGARSGGAPVVEFAARGRGAAGIDSVVERVIAGARGAGGGSRGGGRGGRSGGGADPTEVVASAGNIMTEMTYRRLFEGITLTPEQETIARALIANAQEQTRLEMPPIFPVLRVNQARGVVAMSEESAAALDNMLSSEADRATLQARITKLLIR